MHALEDPKANFTCLLEGFNYLIHTFQVLNDDYKSFLQLLSIKPTENFINDLTSSSGLL